MELLYVSTKSDRELTDYARGKFTGLNGEPPPFPWLGEEREPEVY